jgi:predicted Zn-ribbon and HTH transcriptional regulator
MPGAMARANRPLSFDVRGLERGAAEEVSVGAYARRQLRRRVLLGVFGGVLIAGALTLYGFLRPPGRADRGDRYAVCVRCAACGHTEAMRVRFDQTFPVRCSKCKELACRVVWRCRECGHQFVPEQMGTALRCPKCGSERVGSAAAP